MSTRLLVGHCVDTLATLPAKSVQCVVTSPPYYGLRDYGLEPSTWADGWSGCLGLEPTPELFLEHLVEVFRAVRRVLRDDGCMWVNMGDSYAGSGRGPSNSLQPEASQLNKGSKQTTNSGSLPQENHQFKVPQGLKAKDLMMMPARLAMALQADGWYLRSQIPWIKRNSMPESVTDRPASAVEYVFLLSKGPKYFWDADAVRQAAEYGRQTNYTEWVRGTTNGDGHRSGGHGIPTRNPESGRSFRNSDFFFQTWQGLELDEDGEPLALVVNPSPYKGAHYATFPPKLVEPMIKAGTSERGQCPDCGAPWARVVDASYVHDKSHANGAFAGERLTTTEAQEQSVNGGPQGMKYGRANKVVSTTGWQPTCAHADLTPVPQTVLDPFFGSGTVGMMAERLGRNAIGCELNPEYAQQAVQRVTGDSPMFVDMEVT